MNYMNEVRQFIVDNFLFGDDGNLTEDTSFFEKGIIDSTGILELIGFLEEKYGVSIKDEELVPENFENLSRIGYFLEKKLNGKTETGVNA